ncbi:MAG: TrmH family RNA methyltransferase [Nitrospinales bacterium]
MKKQADPTGRQIRKTRSQRIRDEEFTLCGWNACMRAFERRPEDIRRIFFSRQRSSGLREVKKWCGSRKLPYRELDDESLSKAAGGVHHEGVVMVVRPLPPAPVHRLAKAGLPANAVLVALDRVGNTHNVGAVLRSCAYFGVDGLLLAPGPEQAVITPSAARTAEGALELVPLYHCTDLPSALRDFKARSGKPFVLGADPDGGRSLYEIRVSFPCVVVLGNERQGLSARVKRRCDALARIPGNDAMQSLNVAVAAGIILAELARRKQENDT